MQISGIDDLDLQGLATESERLLREIEERERQYRVLRLKIEAMKSKRAAIGAQIQLLKAEADPASVDQAQAATIAEQIASVLVGAQLHVEEIKRAINEQYHRAITTQAASSYLSRNPAKFVKTGEKGVWKLAEDNDTGGEHADS